MASSVDIVSALGHGLVASQSGPSAGYDAIDDRRAWSAAAVQQGVIDGGSYEVTQRAAGANMTVDVAANVGGGACVGGSSVAVQGMYRIAPHTAVINVDIAAANATNPRVDIVILEVKDDAHDVGGLNVARVRVISGTATSGATLDNRTGAAALPSSALLLADVHVPATDTTISNSQIRDRRTWARGAFHRIVRNANAAAGSDYSPAGTNIALLDATNVAPRIECSGVPMKVSLLSAISGASVGDTVRFSPQVDSMGMDGMSSVGASVGFMEYYVPATTNHDFVAFQWTFTPAAGSHIIAPGVAMTGAGKFRCRAGSPLVWTVEELVRQDTKNNATTTG